MFKWLKKNLANPVVNFFKEVLGIAERDRAIVSKDAQIADLRKEVRSLNEQYDPTKKRYDEYDATIENLTRENNTLVRNYDRLVRTWNETEIKYREKSKELFELKELIKDREKNRESDSTYIKRPGLG